MEASRGIAMDATATSPRPACDVATTTQEPRIASKTAEMAGTSLPRSRRTLYTFWNAYGPTAPLALMPESTPRGRSGLPSRRPIRGWSPSSTAPSTIAETCQPARAGTAGCSFAGRWRICTPATQSVPSGTAPCRGTSTNGTPAGTGSQIVAPLQMSFGEIQRGLFILRSNSPLLGMMAHSPSRRGSRM